jgi:thioredoxin-related protein
MVLVHVNRMISTRTVLALLLLAASAALAAEPSERNPREFFFTLSFGDLPEELQDARQQGKLGMLLFFEAEECPYCQHMLKNVFSQRDVQDWYRDRFVNIAIDIHGDVEIVDFDGTTLPSKEFADQQGVFLTPVVTFIDLDGSEIHRHLGMVKTPQEFLLLGKYIEGGFYKEMEFKVFAEARGMQESDDVLTTPSAAGDTT